jgi:hypothetical protein
MTRAEMMRRMPAAELTEWSELYVIEAQEAQARAAKTGG